jgi:hypothetical protein
VAQVLQVMQEVPGIIQFEQPLIRHSDWDEEDLAWFLAVLAGGSMTETQSREATIAGLAITREIAAERMIPAHNLPRPPDASTRRVQLTLSSAVMGPGFTGGIVRLPFNQSLVSVTYSGTARASSVLFADSVGMSFSHVVGDSIDVLRERIATGQRSVWLPIHANLADEPGTSETIANFFNLPAGDYLLAIGEVSRLTNTRVSASIEYEVLLDPAFIEPPAPPPAPGPPPGPRIGIGTYLLIGATIGFPLLTPRNRRPL